MPNFSHGFLLQSYIHLWPFNEPHKRKTSRLLKISGCNWNGKSQKMAYSTEMVWNRSKEETTWQLQKKLFPMIFKAFLSCYCGCLSCTYEQQVLILYDLWYQGKKIAISAQSYYSSHSVKCLARFPNNVKKIKNRWFRGNSPFYYIELPQKSKQNEPGIFCRGRSY